MYSSLLISPLPGALPRAVGSAVEALAALANTPFDLLISDISMPGEDGYALLRQVRRHYDPQVRELPAIALTAYARTEHRVRVLAAGYQMHIPKPVEAAELLLVAASLTQDRRSR